MSVFRSLPTNDPAISLPFCAKSGQNSHFLKNVAFTTKKVCTNYCILLVLIVPLPYQTTQRYEIRI